MTRPSRDRPSRRANQMARGSCEIRELAEAVAELRRAEAAAQAAWTRLEASPSTLEYQVEWSLARREEAAAAGRLKRAREADRSAHDR